MLRGLLDALSSERAIATLALIIASTAFVLAGSMPLDDWQEYTRDILAFYIAGKTVTGVADRVTAKRAADSPASAPAAKKPK